MIEMKQEAGILDGLMDIELEPLVVTGLGEDSRILLLALLLGLLLLGAFVARLWRYFHSPRHRGLKQLRQLQLRLRSEPGYSHPLVFELAEILRDAFAVIELSSATPLPVGLASERQRWTVFNHRLMEARYAPGPVSARVIAELLQESEYWIRRWR